MHKHPENQSYLGSSGQTLTTNVSMGESLHCARTARYFWTMFPPKSPQAHPLETPLELGDPNSPIQ